MAVLPEVAMCEATFYFAGSICSISATFHRYPITKQILHALLQVFREHLPCGVQLEDGLDGAQTEESRYLACGSGLHG